MRFLGIRINGYEQLLEFGIGQNSNKLLLGARIRDFILNLRTEKRSIPSYEVLDLMTGAGTNIKTTLNCGQEEKG